MFNVFSSLALKVEVANTLDIKLARLVPILKGCTGPSIIYVTLQKHTEVVANYLRPHGLDASVYHAGLPAEQRAKVQSDFMESELAIVICTIAFGMGIDKGMKMASFIIKWPQNCFIKQIYGRFASNIIFSLKPFPCFS